MADRFQIRRTTTKATPGTSDLLDGELGYSFQSGSLFIKNPVTGAIDLIAGKTQMDALASVNLPPVVNPDTGTVVDAVGVVSGNVLTNDSDANGDTFTVNSVSYGASNKTVGTSFNTTYGSMIINADGSWTYTVGAAGHALTSGSPAVTEVFTYTVIDTRGGISKSTTLTITLTGTNEAPILNSDSSAVPTNTTSTGNVLSNDSDPEGTTLTVTRFTLSGNATVYSPGQTATVAGVGSLSIASNGVWTFTPVTDYAGNFPLVTYTATDGVNSVTSTLFISVVTPPVGRAGVIAWFNQYRNGLVTPTNIATNPPVARVAADFSRTETFGSWDWKLPLPNRNGASSVNLDFRVGPGKEYTEINQVPWLSLLPGDRVFIYYRSTPYSHVLPVHVRGDAVRWIEIIGVRGPNGELPILDAAGAIEDPNIVKVNQYHTGAGMINIMRPLDGRASGGFKPGYIHIHGLEVRNTLPSKSLTDYTGATRSWGDAAGIRALGGDHITISGCYVHACANGLFVNSTEDANGLNFFKTRYLHSLFNYFEGNSTNGAYGTHNCYTEATAAIHEFNYYGPLVTGSGGDLLKERSCGNIFRYNYFSQGAANCISIRDPESQYKEAALNFDTNGLQLSNNSVVHSNTFFSNGGSAFIGYGDGAYANNGEIRRNGKCFLYKNRFISKVNQTQGWIAGTQYNFGAPPIFAPWNELPTLVVLNAKNNLFYAESAGGVLGPMSVFSYQGSAEFTSNYAHNLQTTYYSTSIPRDDTSVWFRGAVFTGTLASLNLTENGANAGFNNFSAGDYTLVPSSPFYGLTAADDTFITNRGLQSEGNPIAYPFGDEPAPVAFRKPAVTGSPAAGSLLTGVDGGYTPYPTTLTSQWLKDGIAIPGATGNTYQTVSGDANHVITYQQSAQNAKAQAVVSTSDPFYVLSASTPQNTVLPVVSGSLQDGFPLTTDNGTWTNNPVSYSYKWFLDGVEVAGQTTSTYTPSGAVGKTVQSEVKATNSTGEFSAARSALVTIIAPTTDPDAYGKFNFSAASGTSLQALSSKWASTWRAGNPFSVHVYCNGSGGLTADYVSYNQGGQSWYVNGQSDMVPVEIGFDLQSVGTASIWLRCDAAAGTPTSLTQGLGFTFFASQIGVYDKDYNQLSIWSHTFPNASVMKVVPRTGGNFDIYVNGTLFQTYTNASAPTGGYPGLAVQSGSGGGVGFLNYWTDNPA